MNISQALVFIGAALSVSFAALAHDYPTTDRVEYVLECMQQHDGKYEYVYKCSCAIDAIAKEMPYDEFVESSMSLRNQSLQGARGAEFRDPESVKEMAKKYKTLKESADKQCFIKN
ncbi:MAG: hypothetical protein WCD07_12270 [Burkholderiales bacterium]